MTNISLTSEELLLIQEKRAEEKFSKVLRDL